MAKKPRKPLSSLQLEDAARLRGLWDRRPFPKVSQEEFAASVGWTQGAVEQYLNGRIPLNLEAAGVFAKGLRRRISDFSPLLAARIVELYEIEMPTGGEVSKPVVAVLFDLLSAAEQKEMMDRLMSAVHANRVSKTYLKHDPNVMDDRQVEKILKRKQPVSKGTRR